MSDETFEVRDQVTLDPDHPDNQGLDCTKIYTVQRIQPIGDCDCPAQTGGGNHWEHCSLTLKRKVGHHQFIFLVDGRGAPINLPQKGGYYKRVS